MQLLKKNEPTGSKNSEMKSIEYGDAKVKLFSLPEFCGIELVSLLILTDF